MGARKTMIKAHAQKRQLVGGLVSNHTWRFQGAWVGARRAGGRTARDRRAGARGVGRARQGNRGPCVVGGGDLLSAMGLATGGLVGRRGVARPGDVAAEEEPAAWRRGSSGGAERRDVAGTSVWRARRRGASWRGRGRASQWGRCHLCATVL